jgi:allophanate hydrolase subunit 2
VYSERRHVEAGVTSVMLTVCSTSGSVTLVGGDAAGARTALVPELLAMANLVLRNPADAAAIEIDGCLTIQVHGSPLGVAIDDDGAVTMAATNKLTVASAARGRVRYLAVAGGIEPFGTHGPGKPVEVGTHLRPGGLRGLLVGGPGRIDLREDDVIGVRPGADAARFAEGSFEALVAGKWTKAARAEGGERVAQTLTAAAGGAGAGAAIAPVAGGGAPVTRGSIVVAPDGTLRVAGPDHPAGPAHPVLAVVDAADLGRLAARVNGASVAFATR